MGLTPKQPLDTSKKGWGELDRYLKQLITREGHSAFVRISDYDIPEQEIISEAEKNGYTVTKSPDGLFLDFS